MSYHVNDLINFEAIEEAISSFRNRHKMLFVYEYWLMCYNKCLIFISKQEKEPANMLDIYQPVIQFRGIRVHSGQYCFH